VHITADGAGRPIFDESAMRPGDPVDECQVLTYTGSHLPVDVSLTAAVSAGGLEHHLDLIVEHGTGGRHGDCSGFVSHGVVFSGTIGELGTASADRPLVVWSPVRAGDSRTFRLVVELEGDPDAQGGTAAASVVWEARGR
jgi:hypothetical protein